MTIVLGSRPDADKDRVPPLKVSVKAAGKASPARFVRK